MLNSSTLSTIWAPRALTLLRVMAGLLFVEHGTAKLFNFPEGGFPGSPPLASMIGASAIMEFAGGLLITIGLFTRPVAFLLAGEMAVAYFLVHAPGSFFPILNHGEGAILYCFIFLYLFTTGAGPWSVDEMIIHRPAPPSS